ncbi:MAG: hypothetical protein Q9172_004565 [Xanthocarpia lactea]
MGVGLSAAAPSAEPNKGKNKKNPPGPPDASYGSVSQTCSASQKSIRCCTVNGGQGKSHNVKYKDDEYNLVCSQLYSGEYEGCSFDEPSNMGPADDRGKPVQAICEQQSIRGGYFG